MSKHNTEYTAEGFVYGGEFSDAGAETEKNVSKLQKIVRGILYFTIFMMPLWFLPFTVDVLEFNKQVLLTAAAGLGILFFLIDVIKKGAVRYRTGALLLAFEAMILMFFFAMIFSVSRYNSIFGFGVNRGSTLITWVSVGVLLFLAISVFDRGANTLKKVLTVSFALTFLVSALQLLGLSIFPGAIFAAEGFNTIGTANALGVFAAAVMPIFFSGFTVAGSKNRNILLGVTRYVGLASSIFILMVVNWLPVWITAAVSLVTFIVFASIARQAPKEGVKQKIGPRSFVLPMGIIVLGIVLSLIGFGWDKYESKLPLEVSPSHRASYSIGLDAIGNRLTGYGPENFSIAYDSFKSSSIANSIFFSTRFGGGSSEVSTMLSEGGLIYVVGLIVFIGLILVTLFRGIKRRFDGQMSTAISWSMGVGLLASFFVYPMTLTVLTALAMVFVIISIQEPKGAKGTAKDKKIDLEQGSAYSFLGSLSFISSLVVVMIVGYFTFNFYGANMAFAQGIRISETDKSAAIEKYVISLNKNKYDTRIHKVLSQEIIKQASDVLEEGKGAEETDSEYDAKLQNLFFTATEIANRATNINPSDSENWMNRGFIHQNLLGFQEGQAEAAISMYDEALVRNPANPLAYARKGSTYLASAERLEAQGVRIIDPQMQALLDNAEKNFNKAIVLYANYGQALYNLGVVYDRKDQIPQAIRQFEQLVVSNNQDPSLAFQLGLLYYRNDQKNDAVAAWERAVLLFPEYSNARWYLSLAYEERGDLQRALEQVEKVEPFNPGNEFVEARMAQLKEGIQLIVPPDTDVLDAEPLN